jgi:uncharacterized protein
MIEAVFVEPWPFWAAGLGIGLFVTLFAWVTGKPTGVSTGLGSACGLVSSCAHFQEARYREPWRLMFVLGIPLGGLLAAALAQGTGLRPTFELGAFERAISAQPMVKAGLLFLGGALLGFGARWAGGCTSGHAIVGVAQGAKSSLVATAGFMVGGVVVVNLLFRVIGG